MTYETVIGLEIHAELSTKTKAFCACGYRFGAEVNTQCCPICLGLPDAPPPTLNKNAAAYAVRLGLAAGCKINRVSTFCRKHYFYPDLPKGYQITQGDIPICQDGMLEFIHKGKKHAVRIHRIHLEEDTAKLLHDDAFKGILLDFNRCGVPLVEIVTGPDLRGAEEVRDFLEAMRTLLVTLGISSGRMQEGVMRCDVNVSIRPTGQEHFNPRVEMKNVNTFTGAAQAVLYEVRRQTELLKRGETVTPETRRWDEQKGETQAMRTKGSAADYRMFPDPDLPPIVLDESWINEIKESLPELPVAKYERYICMGVAPTEAEMLAAQPERAAFLDACNKIGGVEPRNVAHWLFGVISALHKKHGSAYETSPITPEILCEVLDMIKQGRIGIDAGKRVLEEMFISTEPKPPEQIVKRLSLEQVSDGAVLEALVDEVLAANGQSISDYRNGKKNAFTFLVGQCMKASKGKANPQLVNEIINSKIG
ncbi:MAG: Asp-tRNA(Asn)/Glu-tRNA(Gln) amidotransferase subunit GatB [Defluviitaleaceae bacterium]|nr:Asp-tRNA(Asn)/Glu-tRNA(Gln) amidotransferase subunit GatB [Defluviitaleaceae bacterium]